MDRSVSIARIAGPTLVVMVTSELRFWNPTLYDSQITPLVYLSGVLMFIAGISVVSRHNIWLRGWQTVITVFGYLFLLLGLIRMFYPQAYTRQFKNDNSALAVEILLIATGLFLSYKGYFAPGKTNPEK